MACLEIFLLGPPLVKFDGEEVVFPRRKALALLAYLVLHRGKCSRDELSYLLFPEKERTRARSDLRLVLSSLRKNLGGDFLISDNHSVALKRKDDLLLDIDLFHDLIDSRRPAREELERAQLLYRDRFLKGFYLDSNGEFENWQLSVEEELQWKYRSALDRLVDLYISEEKYGEAVEACRKLCEIDPLDENLHRRLMELYSLTGSTGKMRDQYEKCRRILEEELGVEPGEETDNLLTLLKERRSRLADKTNLPVRKDTIIGRKGELDQIRKLLTDDQSSLITLVGTGGTGKTLLSLYGGEIVLDHFYHGVYFVDLSGIKTEDEIVVTILQTLNFSDKGVAAQTPADTLISFLKPREMLLILDNFEQLLHEKGIIGEILSKAEHLKILITSRIPLNLEKERLIRLSPLACPPDTDRNLSPSEARQYDSVELFVSRAVLVSSGFSLNRENCHCVCEICRGLDGLPLAIELAVSHLSVLSCRELSERLESHFPDRRQIMWETIEWSYDLLNDEEKTLFDSLSIFRGSFSPDALEAVTGGPVLDPLSALIDKSMVMRSEKGTFSRYYLLDTLREFGEAKLREKGRLDDISRRYGRYYLSLARKAESHLYKSDQIEWISRLKEDDRNLTAALDWAVEFALPGDAVLMIIHLLRYWYYRSSFTRAKTILKNLLDRHEKSLDPRLRGKAYCSLGWMTFVTGSWYESSLYFRKGLICSVESDDLETQILILGRLGVSERWLGDYESGLESGREALYVASKLDDPCFKADALIFFYCTRGGQFDGEDPLAFLEEALSLSVRIEDIWSVTQCLTGLGDYYREKKEYAMAVEYYEQGLKKFKKNGDLWAEAWTMGDLGLTLCRMQRFREGGVYLVDALFQLDRIGDRGGVLIMLNRLGAVSLEEGKGEEAARLLSSANQFYGGLMNSEKEIYSMDKDLSRMMEKCRNEYPSHWISGELMDQRELMSFLSQIRKSLI